MQNYNSYIISTIVVGTLLYYYFNNTSNNSPTIHKVICEPGLQNYCL